MTECAQCGETFYYHNLSAKYCREHNIKATWKRGEYDADRKEADALWQGCCSMTIPTGTR